jgi:hypothetical protein
MNTYVVKLQHITEQVSEGGAVTRLAAKGVVCKATRFTIQNTCESTFTAHTREADTNLANGSLGRGETWETRSDWSIVQECTQS